MSSHLTLRMAIAVFLSIGSPSRATTLFEDLGGEPGVRKLVSAASTAWLADPRISKNFEETDMDRFRKLLYEQLCSLTGGGCRYTGRSMQEAHKALHLATRDFNILAEDMQDSMDSLRIPFATQNRLLSLLAPMHRDVVNK